jgi:hypothetical protein
MTGTARKRIMQKIKAVSTVGIIIAMIREPGTFAVAAVKREHTGCVTHLRKTKFNISAGNVQIRETWRWRCGGERGKLMKKCTKIVERTKTGGNMTVTLDKEQWGGPKVWRNLRMLHFTKTTL